VIKGSGRSGSTCENESRQELTWKHQKNKGKKKHEKIHRTRHGEIEKLTWISGATFAEDFKVGWSRTRRFLSLFLTLLAFVVDIISRKTSEGSHDSPSSRFGGKSAMLTGTVAVRARKIKDLILGKNQIYWRRGKKERWLARVEEVSRRGVTANWLHEMKGDDQYWQLGGGKGIFISLFIFRGDSILKRQCDFIEFQGEWLVLTHCQKL